MMSEKIVHIHIKCINTNKKYILNLLGTMNREEKNKIDLLLEDLLSFSGRKQKVSGVKHYL